MQMEIMLEAEMNIVVSHEILATRGQTFLFWVIFLLWHLLHLC